MSNKLIGILLIVAALIVPLHKEAIRPLDWGVMIVFLLCGILSLLFSRKKKTPSDDIYRITLEFPDLTAFKENGEPEVVPGQQLFVNPYAGENQDDIQLITEDGVFIVCVPDDEKERVLYKYENHSPVRAIVRAVELNEEKSAYKLTLELTC